MVLFFDSEFENGGFVKTPVLSNILWRRSDVEFHVWKLAGAVQSW